MQHDNDTARVPDYKLKTKEERLMRVQWLRAEIVRFSNCDSEDAVNVMKRLEDRITELLKQ